MHMSLPFIYKGPTPGIPHTFDAGTTAGISIAVLLFIALIVLIIFFVKKFRRQNYSEINHQDIIQMDALIDEENEDAFEVGEDVVEEIAM